MAKFIKHTEPEKKFKKFALEFDTLEEAATALALLNTPLSFAGYDGRTVMEWVDGTVFGRKRFTGTDGVKVKAADAGIVLWRLIAEELQEQGFYHGVE